MMHHPDTDHSVTREGHAPLRKHPDHCGRIEVKRAHDSLTDVLPGDAERLQIGILAERNSIDGICYTKSVRRSLTRLPPR